MKDKTLAEILNRIEQRANEIYVRDIIDGKLGSYRLTELSADQVLYHVCRWIRDHEETADKLDKK